jgi:hypothetical protein
MSELNQNPKSDALENLENIIIENLNFTQGVKEDDFNRLQEILVDPELLTMRDRILEVERKLPEIFTNRDRINVLDKKIGAISQISDQLQSLEAKIQDIPGDPISQQLATIQATLEEIQSKIDNNKDIVKIIIPIISNLMQRQFTQFKQELFQEMILTIKSQQEEQKNLSIRVTGIQANSDASTSLNESDQN